MKPMHVLIAAMILLIGAPTPSSSQNSQKKESKTQTAKPKKSQKATAKSVAKHLTSGQSSLSTETPSPEPAGVLGSQVLQKSVITQPPAEPVRPIVLKAQKSPGLALGLSAVLPGCGQYYNGDYLKGAIQTGIFAAGVVVALTLGTESSYSSNAYTDYSYYGTYTYYRPSTEEWDSAWLYVGIGVAAGAWLWSVIDAPISASSANDESNGSNYGHMFESGNPGCVVGVDVAALQGGAGVNLAIHF